MVHVDRAHIGRMIVVIMVALSASCLTWFFVRKTPECRGKIINGAFMADVFRVPPSKAQWLLKVIPSNNTEDDHLTWEAEWRSSQFSLGEKKWITVKESGVYLVFAQVTYELVKKEEDSSTVNLQLIVNYNYTEGCQQFASAFDTRPVTENMQHSHLSLLLQLKMIGGERLSLSVLQKNRIKYDDIRPFSTFVTIIRYADL